MPLMPKRLPSPTPSTDSLATPWQTDPGNHLGDHGARQADLRGASGCAPNARWATPAPAHKHAGRRRAPQCPIC
eukprot:11211724-Lingulodinium_polyedra.AAC.1